MSWKSFACMAALGAMASTAAAVPSIEIVDNADGTGVVNIVTDAAGSLGVELDLILTGATLTDATINTTLFDDANPGDNPFINGLDSPIGGDTTGLGLELGNNRLFAAYGSGDLGIGTHEFLSFTYSGSGTADAGANAGNVAQGGLNNAVADLLVDIGGVAPGPGDTNGDGLVDATDLAAVGINWDPAGPGVPPYTREQGDLNGDNKIDASDLAEVGINWNPSGASAAIPEPTSVAMLAAIAGIGFTRRRK